jgi:predicted lipoprotein with Yx(FWY)xxD motif
MTYLPILVLLFLQQSINTLLLKSNTTNSKNFLKVRTSSIGEYIIDSKGMALYIFENDGPNRSKCTEECKQIWTPLSADGVSFPPDVDYRLDTSYVGLIRGVGGKYQVTYRKKPLYRFNLDKDKSDRKGHRLRDFGGLWSLLKPDGTALDMRLSNANEKVLMPEKVIFTSTGFSSVLTMPNTFQIKINISESNTNFGKANSDFKNNFDNLNSTLSNMNKKKKITLFEKKISLEQNIFSISQTIMLNSEDIKQISILTKKLNEISTNSNNKVLFTLNFIVSNEQLNNSKSLIYFRAIKDASENAEILLKPIGLRIDKSNPIKSIIVDSNENQIANPDLPQAFTVNSIMFSMKATVSYNIKTL